MSSEFVYLTTHYSQLTIHAYLGFSALLVSHYLNVTPHLRQVYDLPELPAYSLTLNGVVPRRLVQYQRHEIHLEERMER
jgi:hypothetical protein